MNLKHTSILLAGLLVGVAAVPAGSAQLSTSASVGNLIPVVTDVAVAATVNPTAGSTTSVPVTVTVADNNGYQDIASVTVTVLKPDGTTVHVAATPATSNADGSGVAQTYAYSFSMEYFDDPGTYTVKAIAADAASAASLATTGTFAYSQLAALSLGAASVDFGTIDPGTRSAVSTLAVANHGNVQIDIDTSGSDLSDGDGHSIAASRIKYDLVATDMGNETSLTTSPFNNAGFDLAKGSGSSKGTYWQLATPSGEKQYLPAGTYTGTVTISAVQG